MTNQELKKFLSRYSSWTCPDWAYLAWKIFFDKSFRPKNKSQILKDTKDYIKERKDSLCISRFDKSRPQMKDLVNKKFNW